jgi:hypothetical protein
MSASKPWDPTIDLIDLNSPVQIPNDGSAEANNVAEDRHAEKSIQPSSRNIEPEPQDPSARMTCTRPNAGCLRDKSPVSDPETPSTPVSSSSSSRTLDHSPSTKLKRVLGVHIPPSPCGENRDSTSPSAAAAAFPNGKKMTWFGEEAYMSCCLASDYDDPFHLFMSAGGTEQGYVQENIRAGDMKMSREDDKAALRMHEENKNIPLDLETGHDNDEIWCGNGDDGPYDAEISDGRSEKQYSGDSYTDALLDEYRTPLSAPQNLSDILGRMKKSTLRYLLHEEIMHRLRTQDVLATLQRANERMNIEESTNLGH